MSQPPKDPPKEPTSAPPPDPKNPDLNNLDPKNPDLNNPDPKNSDPTPTKDSDSPDDFDQAMDAVLDHYEEYKKTDETPREKPKPGSHMLPPVQVEKKKKKKKPKKPKKPVYDDDEYDEYDDTYDHMYY